MERLRPWGDQCFAARTHLVLALTGSVLLFAGSGCATQTVKSPKRVESPEERYARDGERIAADPVVFLRQLRDRCEALDAYRLLFYRQERSGIPAQLGPMEEIHATFRREPFSIKFEWPSNDMPYYESVYVAGQNDDKLIVRERKGFLFFRPQVRVVNLMDPVKWGRAKNPVTDFGLARVTQRTLLPFEDPEIVKVMTIKYEGVVLLEQIGRAAHYLRIDRPKVEGLAYTRQDFYIDADTLLPAGTDLYLPSGDLDARYRYTEVRPDVTLTDADFRLSKDHPKLSAATAK